MELTKQVCTAIQGKRLVELGVTMEAQFNHCVFCPDPLGEQFYNEICFSGCTRDELEMPGEIVAPAYTVAELGDLLPTKGGESQYASHKTIDAKMQPVWTMLFVDEDGTTDCPINHPTEPTEAQARAAMLIYLLENNLHTIK